MKPIHLTFLSQREVIDCMPLREASKIVETVLKEHGAGRFENPPKPGIHPLTDAFIHAMPAYLSRLNIGGMKWVSGFSSNPKNGLPMITGVIVLNDMQTGFPIAAMDGGYVTAIRTAAVSGVAARYLARKDTAMLGLVGAGVQGRYHLLVLKDILKNLETVCVYDANPAILDRFVSSMSKMVPFDIRKAASPEEAIRGADVVITATGVLGKPIFKEAWIKKEGALVLPVHSKGWESKALRSADKFLCDDYQQFTTVLGHPGGYYWPIPKLHAQLGEVVLGKKPGRRNECERIVAVNFGMAIHDIAIATEVLKRAKRNGYGKTMTLVDNEMPFMQ
jgi:ornithine cyclodeaminase/alanine dehydrogenase